eukprot:4517573-Heterocapsa_arctica.AAC.2
MAGIRRVHICSGHTPVRSTVLRRMAAHCQATVGQSLSSLGLMESAPGALATAIFLATAARLSAVRGSTVQGVCSGICSPQINLKSSKVGGMVSA